MAVVARILGAGGSCSSLSSTRFQNKIRRNNKNHEKFRVSCAVSFDPYITLNIHTGASESQIKKAFTRLALKVFITFYVKNDCLSKFKLTFYLLKF